MTKPPICHNPEIGKHNTLKAVRQAIVTSKQKQSRISILYATDNIANMQSYY